MVWGAMTKRSSDKDASGATKALRYSQPMYHCDECGHGPIKQWHLGLETVRCPGCGSRTKSWLWGPSDKWINRLVGVWYYGIILALLIWGFIQCASIFSP